MFYFNKIPTYQTNNMILLLDSGFNVQALCFKPEQGSFKYVMFLIGVTNINFHQGEKISKERDYILHLEKRPVGNSFPDRYCLVIFHHI